MMTTFKRALLAAIVAGSAAATASAGIDFEKDPVKDFKADLAEQEAVVPAASAVPVDNAGGGAASATSVLMGQAIGSSLLPPGHAQSCLKAETEFVIDAGQVVAEYTCCKAVPINGKPDCLQTRYAFPDKRSGACRTRGDDEKPQCQVTGVSPGLRYDAGRRAILWGDEVIATHGDPEDHGPYWKFYLSEGFLLKTRVIPMSIDGRPAADWIMVSLAATSSQETSSPQPPGNRCGR